MNYEGNALPEATPLGAKYCGKRCGNIETLDDAFLAVRDQRFLATRDPFLVWL